MAILTPQEQKAHDERLNKLLSQEAKELFDSMTGEELRQALKTAKMILDHKENEYEDAKAKINYRIGYIRGKLEDIYTK